MTIIQQLRHLRICQGMSQEELSKKAGYWPSTVGRWEQGRNNANDKALTDLAQALGYEIVLRPICEADSPHELALTELARASGYEIVRRPRQ